MHVWSAPRILLPVQAIFQTILEYIKNNLNKIPTVLQRKWNSPEDILEMRPRLEDGMAGPRPAPGTCEACMSDAADMGNESREKHLLFLYSGVLLPAFVNRSTLEENKLMARNCEICGKGPSTGNNVSHANNKTKRRFLPNLRVVRITLEDGTTKKIKVAASTLRTMKKGA